MRINKYLAMAQLGSRRKVEELISKGEVSVNGTTVTQLATQITDNDVVFVNNKPVTAQTKMTTVMLNKPIGYLSSTADQDNKPCVLHLLPEKFKHLYPVGRLDFNTQGMLLLTNDGALTNQIIHPKGEIEKVYEVLFRPKPTPLQLKQLTQPMNLDGYTIAPAQIEQVKAGLDGWTLHMTIHEGRNRQIRKMFAATGLKILALKRIQIGKLTLGTLKTGQYKILTSTDISQIFN